jgi:hypothetical protein
MEPGAAMTNLNDSTGIPIQWRKGMPADTQAQLTQLVTECADICRGMLNNFQPFGPLSLARKHNGGLTFQGGVLIPESVDDPISYLLDQLYRARANFTAISIVHDVETENQPVMRIYLEHNGGDAFRVWIPWRRLGDDRVRLEQPVMQSTPPMIWSDAD